MNDIIIRHYPRDFLSQVINRSINIRDTLLRLNSLRYTIQTMESLIKKKDAYWDNTTTKIKRLRENWFEAKDYSLLVKMNKEAVEITMDVTSRFRNFLLKRGLVKIISGNKIKFNGAKNKSLFIKNWDKDKALKGMESSKNKKYCSILPIELAPQLVEYSKAKGEISKHLKKNIRGDISYKLEHEELIRKRVKILNSQAKLANKLKHSDFPAFFDFGYRSRSGINNLVLNVLDRLRY